VTVCGLDDGIPNPRRERNYSSAVLTVLTPPSLRSSALSRSVAIQSRVKLVLGTSRGSMQIGLIYSPFIFIHWCQGLDLLVKFIEKIITSNSIIVPLCACFTTVLLHVHYATSRKVSRVRDPMR
jgi:hypothetical protein